MPDQLRSKDDFLASVNFKGEITGNTVERNYGDLLLCRPSKESDNIRFLSPQKRQRLIYIQNGGNNRVFHITEEFLAHQVIDFTDFFKIKHFDAI